MHAFKDMIQGLTLHRLVGLLAWRDSVLAQRRAVLGAAWLTLQTLGWIVCIYLIFGNPTRDYLAYVAIGVMVFQSMSIFLTDGVNTFVKDASLIKNIPNPLSIYVYRLFGKSLIHTCFDIPVVLGVIIVTGFAISVPLLGLAVLGFLFTLFAWTGMAFCVGVLGVAVRDLASLIQAVMRVAFFATPIFWRAEGATGGRAFLAIANPFSHFLEVVRAPLLGQVPDLQTYLICAGLATVFWIMGIIAFVTLRWRIATWV